MERPGTTEFLFGITRAEDLAEYTKIENKKIEERAKGSDQTDPPYQVEPNTLEKILGVAGEVRDLAFQPGVTDDNKLDWGQALQKAVEDALFPNGKPDSEEVSTEAILSSLDEKSANAIFYSLDEVKQQAEQATVDH